MVPWDSSSSNYIPFGSQYVLLHFLPSASLTSGKFRDFFGVGIGGLCLPPPKKIEKHSGQKLPVALNTLRTNGKIRRAFGPALRIWVKLPPKNEGNVGSHGRNYFGNQAFGDHISGFQWFMCRNKADGPCFQFALKIAAFFRPTFANQPKPALQPTLEQ